MKKFDVRWATLIVFAVLLSGWWYWYEYRPKSLEEECYRFSLLQTRGAIEGRQEASWSTEPEYHEVVERFQRSCVDAGGVEPFGKTLNASDPFKKTRQ